MGNCSFFLSWRQGILARYDGLFGGSEDEEDDRVGGYEASEDDGRRRTHGDVNESAEEKTKKKWAWFSLIYSLCDGDITKVDAVLNRTYIECLTWLSYEKDMKK